MKTKIITVLIVSISFLSVLLCSDIVKGASYTIDFDDGTLTNQNYSNGYFTAWSNRPASCIDNTHANSGTKSYKVNGETVGSTACFNFTTLSNVVNLSFYLYDVNAGATDYLWASFYNSLNQPVIQLRWTVASSTTRVFSYYNVSSASFVNLETANFGYMWNKFAFSFIDNDSVVYYHNSTTYTEVPAIVADNYDIKRINITFNNPVKNVIAWFDDIVLSAESFVGGGTQSFSYADYNNWIFNRDNVWVDQSDNRYLEFTSGLNFNGEITAVTLPVSESQFLYISNDTTDYVLYINSYCVGYADALTKISNYQWAIQFTGFNVNVTNEPLILEFGSLATASTVPYYGSNLYWVGYRVGISFYDYYAENNDSLYFGNGIINGIVPNKDDFYGSSGVPDDAYFGLNVIVSYNINYETGTYADIPTDDLINYQNILGVDSLNSSFISFKHYNEICYYSVGSHPEIIFFIDKICVNSSNTSNTLIYKILRVDINGEGYVLYTGIIDTFGKQNMSGDMTLSLYTFSSTGEYFILLYNTTNNSNTIDSFLYKSPVITVCLNGNMYNPDTGATIPPSGAGGEVLNWIDSLDTFTKTILGIIIIAICVLLPLILVSLIKKEITNVPPVVYQIFGTLGFILNIATHIFEVWTIFFVIFILVLYYGIQYLVAKKE